MMAYRCNPDDPLDETRERGVGVGMPIALHERIDELCNLMREAGYAKPSKKKMLSALVLGSPTDAEELDALVRAYDRARVKHALVAATPKGNVVEFPTRSSGPRPKGSR